MASRRFTLADAGAVYTIDELEVNDAEIDDDDDSSYDNTIGHYGSSVSIDADEDYDLAIQVVGSLSEAGTDTVASYSDGLEYSGSGGSDWQYDDFNDGDAEADSGSGAGSTESDLDVYGTYYSDDDSNPDVSVTYGTDTYSDWNASATNTGESVNFGWGLVNDSYSTNTSEGGMVSDSATGMSAMEDGDYEFSGIRIDVANDDDNESGTEADSPTEWAGDSGFDQDYTLWFSGDNDGTSSSASGNEGSEYGSGEYVVTPGGAIAIPTAGEAPLGTTDLLGALEQRVTVNLSATTGLEGTEYGYGFAQADLPGVSLAYEPDTSVMKGDGLPEAEVSQLTKVEGTGAYYDDVSRDAPPTAAAMLMALAVAGRNPADITIPTNGSRSASGSGGGEGTSGSGSSSSSSSSSLGGPGSGGSSEAPGSTGGSGFGSDDAVVARTGGSRPSGVMVSQGVVSVGATDASGNGATTTGSASAAGDGAASDSGERAEAMISPDGEPSDGRGGGKGGGGGHEVGAPQQQAQTSDAEGGAVMLSVDGAEVVITAQPSAAPVSGGAGSGGTRVSPAPGALAAVLTTFIMQAGKWTPVQFPGGSAGANAVVLNGPPHDNANPSDNHRDGQYKPAFQQMGVPKSQMFDFNEGGHGPGYADSLRAAVELARVKMRGLGPLDVVIYVHGAPGKILVGEAGQNKIGVSLAPADQANYNSFVQSLKLLLTAPPDGEPSGRLFIVGCNVMTGADGKAFGMKLEKDLGVPVFSSKNGSTDIQGLPSYNTPTLVISPGGTFSRP